MSRYGPERVIRFDRLYDGVFMGSSLLHIRFENSLRTFTKLSHDMSHEIADIF